MNRSPPALRLAPGVRCPPRAVPDRVLHRRRARPPRAALHHLDGPVFALVNLPGDRQGRAVRALLALSGDAAPPVPRRVRRLAAAGRRGAFEAERGRARREALRDASSSATATTRSPSSAARTSRASGRRTSSRRSSSARGSARTSSSRRATSPTTRRWRARRAYRYFRDPALGPEYERDDGRAVRRVRRGAAAGDRVGGLGVRGRPVSGALARGEGQGARPAARPAARRVAQPHGHLRHGPDLRAAHPAPARPPAARGAAVRRVDPGRGQGRHAELRGPRRAARPRRRVGRAPAHPRRGGRPLGRAAGARPRGATRRTAARRCACCTSTATRRCCSPRCSSRPRAVSEEDARIRIAALSTEERGALLRDLVGARENRRHRPGRGFEALRYRFEVVADYGAFRDLQRHRMLTVQWQRLAPDLGAGVPEELEAAGVADVYRRGLELSRAEYARLAAAGPRARGASTRCASATASASCWTSTPARRCTSSSCAQAARATRPTAPSRTRCTARSPRCTRRSPRR